MKSEACLAVGGPSILPVLLVMQKQLECYYGWVRMPMVLIICRTVRRTAPHLRGDGTSSSYWASTTATSTP